MLSRLWSVSWRWTRGWALFWNELLGDPLHRSPARAQAGTAPKTAAQPVRPDSGLAPVMVYLEWDSPGRADIEKLLLARGAKYRLLPIDRDEATRSWLSATVKHEPPVVFIGGDLVGGLAELRKLDASGELARRLHGQAAPQAAAAPRPLGDPTKPAQVYGRPSDPWTGRVTDLLGTKSAAYELVDLDDPRHTGLSDRLVQETRRNQAPYVYVRGRYIGGFNAIDELERLGQLDDLLAGRAPEPEAAGRPRVVIETSARPGDDTPPGARN
jgi:glutaredoxin